MWVRQFSKSAALKRPRLDIGVPDLTPLLAPNNRKKVVENLVKRLCVQNEEEAENMVENLKILKTKSLSEPSEATRNSLMNAALEFPNFSHPAINDLIEPRVIFDNSAEIFRNRKEFRNFEELSKILHGSRYSNTGATTTEKSYYLLGPLAELELALVKFALENLKKNGFQIISVPDLLNSEIIEACGLKTSGKITNVFKLDSEIYGNKALSGTAEMGFGSFFANKKIDFSEKSFQKFAAISRCFRAESVKGKREKGLYRVHHFTKVEMFAVTVNDTKISDLIHEQMLSIQRNMFDSLGLFYRILDMHPGDLGAPAARKFDCEAILPGHEGQKFFGEISSTSNCLDYQSRRLNIRDEASKKFCHTVNGTACAVPRMIMALCEQHQIDNGCVDLPKALWPFMPSMKNSTHDFLEPRNKNKRAVFQYRASPKSFF